MEKEKRLLGKMRTANGDFADEAQRQSLKWHHLSHRIEDWGQKGGGIIRVAKFPVVLAVGIVANAVSGGLFFDSILPRAIANTSRRKN